MPSRSLLRGLAVAVAVTLLVALTLAVTTAVARPDEPQTSPSAAAVCFATDYALSCVNRPALSVSGSVTDQVRSLINVMLLGPTTSEQAQGIRSALPAGAKLADVRVIDQRTTIDLDLPQPFLDQLTDLEAEAINQQFNQTLMPYDFPWLAVNARDVGGVYRLISSFVKLPLLPRKDTVPAPSPLPTLSAAPIAEKPAVPGVSGGLTGKTVFMSAGHGWYWNTFLGYYKTQRPVYPLAPYPAGEGVIEDFNNAEAVDQYLLKYLWNSGADAWTVRERDMNTSMFIVDNASVDFATQGAPGAWQTGTGGQAGTYRYAPTINGAATATATWTFTPYLSNVYAVYIWSPNVAITRSVDAHFYVDHADGTTPVTITQARDGNNWRFIGQYPFFGGQPAHISLSNASATSGAYVFADEIRVGGGVGDVSLNGAPISGKPRWEEQASQYAKWVNEPDASIVSDVWIRPRYAEWEKESGEDAVYVAWHTNGASGYTTARGTETYRYLTPFTAGSDVLQNAIHTSLLNAIKSAWDPTWPDRGQLQRDLGEVGQLTTMPGVLIENGFHDNPTDVEAIKDPRFMNVSARAIYHGLVKYWNSIDPSVPLVYLPEPPTQLIVKNSGPGQVKLTWQPGPTDGDGPLGDAATSYRVYTSPDGFGWDNGMLVSTSAYTLSNLAPNQLIYFKVAGVNAGGESFATPVLAARAAAAGGSAPALIVYGYDRIDRLGDIQQNDVYEGLSRRVFVDRMNRRDYIIQHSEAMTMPFDSALHAAISATLVNLNNYTLVDWIAGQEQSPFPSLTTSDQTQLSTFVNNGGALLISGSEIGFELHGTPFYANTLHASFAADDANTYSINSVSGGAFENLGTLSFDDSTHGTYNVAYADVFNPINGATSALVYNNAAGSAAVQYANGCARVIYSGVPLETVYPASARRAVFDRALNFLDVCVPVGLPVDTSIDSPADGSYVKTVPPFDGSASTNASSVQVSVRRVSDTTFYNSSGFVSGAEVWLNASGTQPWTYTLPSLLDGSYALRARALGPGPITDTTPAAITFTLDTIAPLTPMLITPTGGITLVTPAPRFVWQGESIPGGVWDVAIDGTLHQVFELAAPPGITPTTETLTATWPVTQGLHTWRVRATDAAGNVSNWSSIGSFSTSSLNTYLPLVFKNFASEPPPAATCTNILANGDFETGDLTDWVTLAPNPLASVVTDTVYAGQFAARVGKRAPNDATPGFSSIQQDVIVPTNALTATMTFARYRYTNDGNDLQYTAVISGGITNYLLYEHTNDPQWVNAQFDLLPYAGQTIGLRFSVWNKTAASVTGMFIDDVKLIVCTP